MIVILFTISSCDSGGSVDSDRTVGYTLTIQVVGEGSVDSSPGNHTNIEPGTVIDVSASASSGWEFSHWEGEVQDSSSADTKVVVNSNMTITAVFIEEDEGPDDFYDEIPEPDADIDGEYKINRDIKKIYDNVKEVQPEDKQNIESFSQAEGKLVFTEKTGFVESLQVGDVIISDPDENNKIPYGLIHHIENISSDGLMFDLSDATLEDVIEDGEIIISGSFDFADLVQGMVVAPDVRILDIDFGEQIIKFEREFSRDRGKVTGHIKMHSTLDFDKTMRYRLRLEHLKFILNSAIEIDVNYEANKEVKKDELFDLFVLQGPPIVIFTGVWVNPRIAFRAGAKASIEGGASTGVTWSRNYTGGIEYNRASGFETIRESSGDGFQIKPVTLEGSAEAKAFAGIALEGRVWGSAGFGIGVMGYTKAEGKVEADHTQWAWEYDISLGAKVLSKAQLELSRIAKLTYDGPEFDLGRLPLAYAASGRVVEEIEKENGEIEEVGLADVDIHFDGPGAGGRELTSVTTDENGFWHKDLMAGTVMVSPEKVGYETEVEEFEVDKARSDVNFTMQKVDLTGIWPGTLTIQDFNVIYEEPSDEDEEGCELFDQDILRMIVGQPLDIILTLERIDPDDNRYEAELVFAGDVEIDSNIARELFDSIYEVVNLSEEDIEALSEESMKLDGVFENNILTLDGVDQGTFIELRGTLVENDKLEGNFDSHEVSEPRNWLKGDWSVKKSN